MWRIPASTDSRSSCGSARPASHRRPLTPNRSLHGGRPFSRRTSTAWISFFARDRERTSCSRRANRRRITRQRSSGIHTDSSSPRESNTASVRASSRSVFARACTIPVSSGETTITRSTCGSSSRATSHAVTSNATRSVLSRLAASAPIPSGVLATRPAERTTPSSQIATTQKSRCTSRPIARPAQPDTRTVHLPTRISGAGDATGQRHRPIRAQSSIHASRRGGRTKSPGSKPIAQTGLPTYILPEGPYPGSTEPTNGAGQTLHTTVSCREGRHSWLRHAVDHRRAIGPDSGAWWVTGKGIARQTEARLRVDRKAGR